MPRANTERQALLTHSDDEDADQPRPVMRQVWARLGGFSQTLLALVAVFGGLFASTKVAPGQPPATVPPAEEVCLTPECVLGAASILQNIDTSVPPCADFYQFACGGWMATHPIPDSKSRISTFDTLQDRNTRTLKAALEGPYTKSRSVPKGQEEVDRENFETVTALYKTCLNETAIDAEGAAPLVHLAGKLDKKFPDLAEATAFVHDHGVDPVVGMYVMADFLNPDMNAIYIRQGGLSLPSPEYYQDNATVTVLHSVAADLLSLVLETPPKGSPSFTSVADRILALEKRLAAITIPADELQDPNATYNPMKLLDLQNLTPSFPWMPYLALRFPPASYPGLITLNTTFVVETPKYFKDLETVLVATDPEDLRLMYGWRLVKAYAGSLGSNFREPGNRLREKLTGVKADLPRWETCLRVVDSYVGYMEGKLFVDAAFSSESRVAASRTIDGIKEMMINRIPQLSWIDNATQLAAIEKVKSLKRKIGYPDYTLNPSKLRARYAGLEFETDSYFKNILMGEKWDVQDNLKKILEPVDKTDWDMSPQTVNAYYNPPGNEIVFPAGILQPPFFTAGLPSYLNYGGIGAVVGHELTHAFDNNGREFDSEGRLRDWWGEETSRNFEGRSQCFVDQYGNFSVKGPDGDEVNVNGRLTLGENLADVGGISRAYEAWKADAATPDGATRNFLLPGLSHFTKEQLFFISFANVWCSQVRPAAAVQRIRTDPHSPPAYRVLGAIRDAAQFKLAFGCSGTYPECQLW